MLRNAQLLRASQRSFTRSSPRYRPQKRFSSSSPSSETTGNSFIEERKAVKEHAGKSADLWRKLSLYVVPPCLIISGVNAYNLWTEHWEHWEHLPPLEERPEYPYQNIRAKAYPWGDGDKTLL
ncbi:MAG: anaphase promoting complex subunit 5 [Watsoniomyces obsoletus]|nr:MAG: anaphase promoting complex subunit 5 [Watsoniomyces obsoletus]